MLHTLREIPPVSPMPVQGLRQNIQEGLEQFEEFYTLLSFYMARCVPATETPQCIQDGFEAIRVSKCISDLYMLLVVDQYLPDCAEVVG